MGCGIGRTPFFVTGVVKLQQMRFVTTVLVSMMLAAGSLPPLEVHVHRADGALEVKLKLNAALPKSMSDALPSGAQLSVTYAIQVRRERPLLWNPKIWDGKAVAMVMFDPLTGRYRGELLLNDVIVAHREMTSGTRALDWLRSPPSFRLILPRSKRALILRTRAIFATDTTWLIFPVARGTGWVRIRVTDTP